MAARRTREPFRTCVGCRRVRAKRELVRIVRAPNGVLVADPAGAGRAAYVCPATECLDHARSRLGGALRTRNVDFTKLNDHLADLMSGERLVV